MAKLRFRAKPGQTVLRPGRQIVGQAPVVVGQAISDNGEHAPTDEIIEVEELSAEGLRYKKLVMREGAFECVDEATAIACGQPWAEPAKAKKAGDK